MQQILAAIADQPADRPSEYRRDLGQQGGSSMCAPRVTTLNAGKRAYG